MLSSNLLPIRKVQADSNIESLQEPDIASTICWSGEERLGRKDAKRT